MDYIHLEAYLWLHHFIEPLEPKKLQSFRLLHFLAKWYKSLIHRLYIMRNFYEYSFFSFISSLTCKSFWFLYWYEHEKRNFVKTIVTYLSTPFIHELSRNTNSIACIECFNQKEGSFKSNTFGIFFIVDV